MRIHPGGANIASSICNLGAASLNCCAKVLERQPKNSKIEARNSKVATLARQGFRGPPQPRLIQVRTEPPVSRAWHNTSVSASPAAWTLERNEKTNMQPVKVFAARSFRTAMLSSVAMIAVFGGFTAVMVLHTTTRVQMLLGIAIPALLCAAVLFFAAIVPTMKYTVTNSEVIPSCGPFHWSIPISQIRSMSERDLEWLPWSEGWKIPGYTLFKIRYGGVDAVHMCATALRKRILLIDTESGLWGITPADVDGFVSAVQSKGRK